MNLSLISQYMGFNVNESIFISERTAEFTLRVLPILKWNYLILIINVASAPPLSTHFIQYKYNKLGSCTKKTTSKPHLSRSSIPHTSKTKTNLSVLFSFLVTFYF